MDDQFEASNHSPSLVEWTSISTNELDTLMSQRNFTEPSIVTPAGSEGFRHEEKLPWHQQDGSPPWLKPAQVLAYLPNDIHGPVLLGLFPHFHNRFIDETITYVTGQTVTAREIEERIFKAQPAALLRPEARNPPAETQRMAEEALSNNRHSATAVQQALMAIFTAYEHCERGNCSAVVQKVRQVLRIIGSRLATQSQARKPNKRTFDRLMECTIHQHFHGGVTEQEVPIASLKILSAWVMDDLPSSGHSVLCLLLPLLRKLPDDDVSRRLEVISHCLYGIGIRTDMELMAVEPHLHLGGEAVQSLRSNTLGSNNFAGTVIFEQSETIPDLWLPPDQEVLANCSILKRMLCRRQPGRSDFREIAAVFARRSHGPDVQIAVNEELYLGCAVTFLDTVVNKLSLFDQDELARLNDAINVAVDRMWDLEEA
jgi:hypothetical protein